MAIARSPTPVLRPFVSQLWASEDPPVAVAAGWEREHVLPTGAMHVVFRLTDQPLRLVPIAGASPGQLLGGCLVGGLRPRFYVREWSGPSASVGAVLRPGAAGLLFGVSAGELSGSHTPLEDLWGDAREIRDELRDARTATGRMEILEAVLVARLPRVRVMHPAIAAIIEEMPALQTVEAAVARSGLSHRHFIANFRHAVGLAPKAYLRILRFQRVLHALRAGGKPSLALVAAEAGYSDQAHLNREFLELAGTTPAAYRKRPPQAANHLRVAARP
jgi:AraC-like DNA-binding protein